MRQLGIIEKPELKETGDDVAQEEEDEETAMISKLINSKNIITIEEGENNETIALNEKDAALTPNGPGKGTGSKITYNPNERGLDINNADGTTGRPPSEGLAHEIIHAEHNNDGVNDKSKSNKVDPDTGVYPMRQEEVNTRTKESRYRQKMGDVQRAVPTDMIERKPLLTKPVYKIQ